MLKGCNQYNLIAQDTSFCWKHNFSRAFEKVPHGWLVSVSFFSHLSFNGFETHFKSVPFLGILNSRKKTRFRISGLFGSKLPGRLLRSVDLLKSQTRTILIWQRFLNLSVLKVFLQSIIMWFYLVPLKCHSCQGHKWPDLGIMVVNRCSQGGILPT